MTGKQILIVEDEEISRENLEIILQKDGYNTLAVENGSKALAAMKKTGFDLVITDLRMPDIDGMQLLRNIRETYPETETLLVTGYATVSSAVEAMHQGAYYYLAKPFKTEELRILVKRALEKCYLRQEVNRLRHQLDEKTHVGVDIIGQSARMRSLRETIAQIAGVDCNVLIQGETGTGKELVARSIHQLSPRHQHRFMAINCASLSEELLGNELFGHEHGAFTGAKGMKRGLLEAADKGTLFLDEIGDMPLAMQVKLLRVLEERHLIRLGGTEEIPIDIRLLAATHRNLKDEVQCGTFRQDLYYRLNVVTLEVPALVQRREDIPLLAYHFLTRFSRSMEKNVRHISEEVIGVLAAYEFPGNVRELENIIERAVVMCNDETLRKRHLPPDLQSHRVRVERIDPDAWLSLAEYEKQYIIRVLESVAGNKTRAAEVLGIDRVSLWRKLKRYHLPTD
jgi:DNA-binding NtrC family response regulator